MQLNIFFNHYHDKDESNLLLKHLSENEATALSDSNCCFDDIRSLLDYKQKIIERMHYSWLEPAINNLTPSLRVFTVAALTPSQKRKFQHLFSNPLPTLIAPIKPYILNSLYKELHIPPILPLEQLPRTEMTPFLELNKEELTAICDYLSLYDLAAELKQIVDKTSIQNIYSCLTAQELSYLKVCQNQKTSLTSPKLGIDPRKHDSKELRSALQQRGLIKLAKALADQHPDLIWYIAHCFDKAKGTNFLQNSADRPAPKVMSILQSQVLSVMNFLKNKVSRES